ncbi:MAG: glycosyl transferase family 2 [Candidatus Levybacteria bacterium CG_4_10_14_0_2_um_filter_35_8]|nr:MAG: glycosyl transferase family 2 [Candidatus Levybacteria bacterium CG_4_10_14_0_2_um_filter_35_8]
MKKITVISSSMVYELADKFPTKEDEVSKIPPPLSTYGFQKFACEYFAKGAWEQYKLPYTIVRPFNCVGIGEERAKVGKEVKTSCEILIIYDLDNDPTVIIATNYIKNNKLKNIFLIKNNSRNGRGVMNAIRTGFKKSKGEVIVVLMADLSDDITQIDQMYKLSQEGFDVICASRYMPKGRKIGGPRLKTFLSKTAGFTLHYIFKISTLDPTNAYKMYKKEIFKNIKIESTSGFEYSLEILLKAHKLGYKITEIPTVWRDREEGKSNFKLLKWLPNYIKWYLSVFKKA